MTFNIKPEDLKILILTLFYCFVHTNIIQQLIFSFIIISVLSYLLPMWSTYLKKKNDNSPNIILSRPVELISDTEYQVSQNKKNAYIYSEIRIKTYRDLCVLLVFPVVTFYLQRVRRKFESELKSSAFQTTKTSISTSCHPLCSHLNLSV